MSAPRSEITAIVVANVAGAARLAFVVANESQLWEFELGFSAGIGI